MRAARGRRRRCRTRHGSRPKRAWRSSARLRDENIRWKCVLPNAGQGGIAVVGDRVQLTTFAEQDPAKPRPSDTILCHAVDRAADAPVRKQSLSGMVDLTRFGRAARRRRACRSDLAADRVTGARRVERVPLSGGGVSLVARRCQATFRAQETVPRTDIVRASGATPALNAKPFRGGAERSEAEGPCVDGSVIDPRSPRAFRQLHHALSWNGCHR